MKSKYKSGKSVAKNQTVPISADDPRVAWDKLGRTKARIGAEIDIVGTDGKSLIAGGRTPDNPTGGTDPNTNKNEKPLVPVKTDGEIKYVDLYGIDATEPENVTADWSGDDLVISFDWNYSSSQNALVSEFIVKLTGGGVTKQNQYGLFKPNKTQTAQTITITKAINTQMFNVFTPQITEICVFSIDPFYNVSNSVCAATVPDYELDLPVPEITVTAITNGYSVAYTTPTSTSYDAIQITEYESTSSTEPTGVTYTDTYFDKINPATVITSNTNARWVKARFSSGGGIFTDYCAAQKVTPTNPVSVDLTPPNEVTAVTGVWSGDNINVSYTLPSTDPATRVQIQLTAPNNLVGYFYRFPTGSETSQTAQITKKDLFDQFGEHYSSFSGILRSIDAADNRSSGVSALPISRTNPLAGITPTFTTVALSNAYSITFTLPTGAVGTQVYAKHTTWSTNPTNDTYLVYAGISPAVIIDTDYTTVYIKVRYYDDFGNTSNYSAEATTTPLNAGAITSFENPITFGANAVIYAGNSPTEGTRTLFKTGGIFAYDATNASPSTQIVSNASAGTPTFITTQAQIADWNITATKIENDLSGTPTKYTGLSATGTYAFWAGSDASGGNSSADFTVTPGGAVTARNISIIGNGNGSSNLLSAGGVFTVKNDGTLTATAATITGAITASSGSFTGNVSIGTSGSLYSGTLSGGALATAGYILNNSGITFSNGLSGNDARQTTIASSTGLLTTNSASIGGWTVDTSTISKVKTGQGKIVLNATDGQIYVTGDSVQNFHAGINSGSGTSDTVFWAGSNATPSNTANAFRVTMGGKVYASDAEITGLVKATSGYIGTETNGWTVNAERIVATGTGSIQVGNFKIQSQSTTDFAIVDVTPPASGPVVPSVIIRTETKAGATESPKRIFLGDSTRQVEVAKSAQISGNGTTSNDGATEAAINAYRSGGLRNMFTVSSGNLSSGIYPSALIGDVLLVYSSTQGI
jgi:hypothetical protein